MDRSRRGFLAGMLALGAAPAIVKASSLMPIFTRKEPGGLLVPAEEIEAYFENSIMDNVLLTPAMITKEALRILHINLSHMHELDRQFTDDYKCLNKIIRRFEG